MDNGKSTVSLWRYEAFVQNCVEYLPSFTREFSFNKDFNASNVHKDHDRWKFALCRKKKNNAWITIFQIRACSLKTPSQKTGRKSVQSESIFNIRQLSLLLDLL